MTSRFVDELQTQIGLSWTVDVPTNASYRSYLHVNQIMPGVRTLVETARRSEAFLTYLALLSKKLGKIDIMESCESKVASTYASDRPSSKLGLVSAISLFSQPAPYFDQPRPDLFPTLCTSIQEPEKKHVRLSALVDKLSGLGNLQGHQTSYIDELRRSMASPAALQHTTDVPEGGLSQNLQRAQERYDSIHSLQLALTGTSIAHQLCNEAGIYPRISPIFLLLFQPRLKPGVLTRCRVPRQPWLWSSRALGGSEEGALQPRRPRKPGMGPARVPRKSTT